MGFRAFGYSFLLIFSTLLNGCYWRSTHVLPDSKVQIPAGVVRIAVFPFKDARTSVSMKKHFEPPTIELQEKLISRLLSNPRFQMVDREELNNIFKEQKLQISGAIEHQTAVELGKILGVQAILVGSINNYGRTLMRMPYTKTTITFRLIEVESARVLCSKEVVANNVNMFYPFRNVSASLNQAVNAIAETINQSQP